jgi:GNAT superfamily N-acetyltransferase
VAELVAIYVHPDRWNQGIGRALVAEAVNRSTELGFSELSLWTLTLNDRALAFYEALGWEPDGREQTHPVARAAALRMRRPLG